MWEQASSGLGSKMISAPPLCAGKIAAVVGSIVGPTLAIILWASITFSHREEKQMVLSGVVRHVKVADMADSNATLITSTSQPSPPLMATPFASPAVKLPFDSASFPQSDASGQVELTEVSRRDSVPVSDTASSLGRAASVSMLGRSASEQQGVGLLDAARNPEPHNITEQVCTVHALILVPSLFQAGSC